MSRTVLPVLVSLFLLTSFLPPLQAADDHLVDFASWINNPRVRQVDRKVADFFTAIDAIEKSDQRSKKTLKTTWKPHLQKLSGEMIPDLEKAVQLLDEFVPVHPATRRLHDQYRDVIRELIEGTEQLIPAIRKGSTASFNRAYKKLQNAVEKKSRVLEEVKKQVGQFIAEYGSDWIARARQLEADAMQGMAEDFRSYINQPVVTGCDGHFMNVIRRLAEMESASRGKKTIRKNWKPHLEEIRAMHPVMSGQLASLQAVPVDHPAIQSIHGEYQRAVSELTRGIQLLAQGIAANSTAKFNMGYTLVTEALKRQVKCADQLKAVAGKIVAAGEPASSPRQSGDPAGTGAGSPGEDAFPPVPEQPVVTYAQIVALSNHPDQRLADEEAAAVIQWFADQEKEAAGELQVSRHLAHQLEIMKNRLLPAILKGGAALGRISRSGNELDPFQDACQRAFQRIEEGLDTVIRATVQNNQPRFVGGYHRMLSGYRLKKSALDYLGKLTEKVLGRAFSQSAQSVPAHGFSVRLATDRLALLVDQEDLVIPEYPLPLSFSRHLDSTAVRAGEMGIGFRHNFEVYLFHDQKKNRVVINGPAHQAQVLDWDPANQCFRRPGTLHTVKRQGEDWSWRDTEGRQWVFSAEGRLLKIAVRDGLELLLAYEKGRLVRVDGPWNQRLLLGWDDEGRVSRVQLEEGRVYHFHYADQRLSQVWLNDGVQEIYRYDDQGRMTAIVMAGDLQWKIRHGEQSLRLEDPFGVVREVSGSVRSGAKIFRTRIGDSRDSMLQVSDDGTIIREDGEGGRTVTTTDPGTGQPLTVRDPNGHETKFEWDGSGRLVKLTDSLGTVREFSWWRDTALLLTMKENGQLALRHEYDADNRLICTTDSRRGKETRQWDESGRLKQLTAFNGSRLALEYGEHWMPVRVLSDGNEFLTIDLDSQGKVSSMKAPSLSLEMKSPDRGRVQGQIKTMLQVMKNTPAGGGWQSPDGTLNCRFNGDGSLRELKFSHGLVQSFRYDRAGRLLEERIGDQSTSRYRYDPAGNLESETQPDGLRCRHSYDPLHRLVASEWSNGDQYRYQWNGDNQRVRIEGPGFTRQSEWDVWHRPLRDRVEFTMAQPSFGAETVHQYDDDKGTETLQVAGGEIVFSKDRQGRLLSVSHPAAGTFRFDWKTGGELQAVHYPNGVDTLFSGTLPDALQMKIVNPEKTNLFSLQLERTDGRILKRNCEGRAETFKYDGTGQLIEAELGLSRFHYQYDGFGNRIVSGEGEQSEKATFAPPGGLLTQGDVQCRYDENLRLVQLAEKDRQLDLQWNGPGQLVKATVRNGEAVTVAEYFYDEKDLLIAEKVDGQLRRTWLWNGLNPLLEMDGAGTPRYLYLTGCNIDSMYAVIDLARTSDAVDFIHRDERNNVVLITDGSGNEKASFTWSPYGRLLRRRGPGAPVFGFATTRMMEETGLCYMRARWYHPRLGRFLSPDPLAGSVAVPRSLNPYLYAGNDPVNHIDPLGTSFWDGLKAMLPGGGKPAPAVSETLATAETTGVSAVGIVVENAGNAYFPVKPKLLKTGSKITQQVVNGARIVQAAEDTVTRSATAGRAVGHGYTLLSSGYNMIRTIDKVEKGEMTVEEGRREIKGEATSAAVGTTLGMLTQASQLGSITVGAAGAIPGAVLVAYGANRTKDIAVAAMEMGDARRQAIQDEQWADSVETSAGMKKVKAIKDAIANNRFKEAMRLNRDLLSYANKTVDSNVDMYELQAMTATLGTEIRHAREDHRRQQEEEARQYNEDLRRRKEEIERQWAEEEAREKEGEKLTAQERKEKQAEARELAAELKQLQQEEEKARKAAEQTSRSSAAEDARFQKELEKSSRDHQKKQEQTGPAQPAQAARPIVQGSMSGRFGGADSSGRITLNVSGTSVSGSFSGTSNGAKISGSISGSYNHQTGKLSASFSGRWKYGKDGGGISGRLSGSQRGSGFAGSGSGASQKDSDFGSWSVSGGQLIHPGQ